MAVTESHCELPVLESPRDSELNITTTEPQSEASVETACAAVAESFVIVAKPDSGVEVCENTTPANPPATRSSCTGEYRRST